LCVRSAKNLHQKKFWCFVIRVNVDFILLVWILLSVNSQVLIGIVLIVRTMQMVLLHERSNELKNNNNNNNKVGIMYKHYVQTRLSLLTKKSLSLNFPLHHCQKFIEDLLLVSGSFEQFVYL
jgi:hypothetical protein